MRDQCGRPQPYATTQPRMTMFIDSCRLQTALTFDSDIQQVATNGAVTRS